MPVRGIRLTRSRSAAGDLVVRPPSEDMEKAILACPSGLNRPSCQTTYKFPVAGSVVKMGMTSPVRTPAPAMLTGASVSWLTMTGADQVAAVGGPDHGHVVGHSLVVALAALGQDLDEAVDQRARRGARRLDHDLVVDRLVLLAGS